MTTTSNVLELLERTQNGFVSGEQMSHELGMSRPAIWKHIQKLKTQGYVIESSKRRGYRLLAKPEQIDVQAIVARLMEQQSSLVSGIKYFESVESTQNIAHNYAREGAPSGTLVIANEQTTGRGRLGRGWLSPIGKGIYMSMVLRPQIPLQFAPQLTLLTAVSLCIALREVTHLPIGIKWPNDLLIHGRKISGILLESASDEDQIGHVIMGVGISVNLTQEDFSEALQPIATSLRIENKDEPVSRIEVIVTFITVFERYYELYKREGFAPIRALWESLSVTLFKEGSFASMAADRVQGTPIALLDSGALVVRQADGTELQIYSASAILE